MNNTAELDKLQPKCISRCSLVHVTIVSHRRRLGILIDARAPSCLGRNSHLEEPSCIHAWSWGNLGQCWRGDLCQFRFFGVSTACMYLKLTLSLLIRCSGDRSLIIVDPSLAVSLKPSSWPEHLHHGTPHRTKTPDSASATAQVEYKKSSVTYQAEEWNALHIMSFRSSVLPFLRGFNPRDSRA